MDPRFRGGDDRCEARRATLHSEPVANPAGVAERNSTALIKLDLTAKGWSLCGQPFYLCARQGALT